MGNSEATRADEVDARKYATKVAKPAIVVQATPDYADGDAVGGLITLADFARLDGGSGGLTRIGLRSLIAGFDVTVHVFDEDPAASTFTENTALVIHADDQDKILRSFSVAAADWVAPQGSSPWYTAELIEPGIAASFLSYQSADGSRDLFFACEADGAINFGTVADLTAIIAAENN